jgi:hypothetical protein
VQPMARHWARSSFPRRTALAVASGRLGNQPTLPTPAFCNPPMAPMTAP